MQRQEHENSEQQSISYTQKNNYTTPIYTTKTYLFSLFSTVLYAQQVCDYRVDFDQVTTTNNAKH